MHAIVVRSTLHDFEQATQFLREQGKPRLQQVPGFVSGQGPRLGENIGTSMLTFESEEAARAAAEQLRSNPPPSSALTIDSVEFGEVVEHA